MEIIGVVAKARQEEAQNQFINSAFVAFQLGAGGDMKFGEYLDKIGLAGNDKPEPERIHITAEQAIAKAESIMRKTGSRK